MDPAFREFIEEPLREYERQLQAELDRLEAETAAPDLYPRFKLWRMADIQEQLQQIRETGTCPLADSIYASWKAAQGDQTES